MPEHAVLAPVPNAESTNSPDAVYVHNVQAVVQAIRYGTGLAGGPFVAGDYLTLTVTGYKNGTKAGEKSLNLVSGTEALKEWTEMDLTSIGSVDALDFHLTSSRDDLPLYCCVDNLIMHIVQVY